MNSNTKNQSAVDASANLVATESVQRSRLAVIGIKTVLNVLPFWWVLIIALALSLATAVYLSAKMATTTHNVGAALIYHPLPIDGGADRLYFPPDLKTLTSLVNSAPVLQKAISETHAETTPLILSRNLTVFEPKSTQRIGLSLGTDHPQRGKELLTAICESAQTTIADMRREVIGNTLQDVRASLERNQRRMKSGREELTKFTGRLQIEDVDSELRDLTTELATLDYQLNTSEIEEEGLRLQHQLIKKQLEDQKKQAELEFSEEDLDAAESLNDARRRQDRLNELIREERRLNEVRAELDARQNVFDRKIKLYEKGYISRGDFEEIESQVKQLQAQIMEGQKIDEWQIELDRLDKQIVPKTGRKPTVSPIIHQIMFRLLELDLGVNNAQEVQRQIAFKQVDARKRRQKLRLFQQEQAALMMEIKAANDEHETLNRQITSLTSLFEMGPSELTIADAPSTAMQQPSSNRNKIFAGLFLGIFMLSTAPLTLLAGIAAARPTVLEHAAMHDLAVLSPRKSLLELMIERRQARGVAWERQVALRIQQLIPKRGSVVAICPAIPREDDDEILQQLAETLQLREENVLIVRLGNSPAAGQTRCASQILESVSQTFGDGVPTLADFLNDQSMTVEKTIGKTGNDISIVYGGDYDPEMIFSQRMSKYLDEVGKQYSIILLYSMDMTETTSVEMLAGHSNGMILLHNREDTMNGSVKRTIDNLCENRAPLFGVAMRPPEQNQSRQRRQAARNAKPTTRSTSVEHQQKSTTGDNAADASTTTADKAKSEVTVTTGEELS